MKADTKPRIPYWAKRRINLIRKQLPEEVAQAYLAILNDLIEHYFKTLEKGWQPELDEEVQLLAAQILPLTGFPNGSQRLIVRLATKKVLTEKEAISCLIPPFRVISLMDKYIGPTTWEDNEEYLLAIHRIQEQASIDFEPEEHIFNEGEVFISVRPDTTKEELVDFIEEYYDSEIKPHLRPATANMHNSLLTDQKRRIKAPSRFTKRHLDLLEMNKQGL